MALFGVLPMVPLVILPMVPLVADGTIGLPMVPLAYHWLTIGNNGTVTPRAYDLILNFLDHNTNYHQIRRVQTGGAVRIHWGKPLYLWNYVNKSWTAFTRLHRTYTELRETTFPPWTANGYTGHLKRALILGMDQLYQIRKDNKVRLLLLEFTWFLPLDNSHTCNQQMVAWIYKTNNA